VVETSALPSIWGNAVPYVIITNNELAEKFQEFADWKTRKGTPAKVVTVDTILKTYKGVDAPEKIRNFIKEAHQKWGTEDVLLGGAGSVIPARWTYWSPQTNLTTDLYYASLEGNWNANGNAEFGEYVDDADYNPDIRVGRNPVTSEEEVKNFLKKNLTYVRTFLAPQPIPGGNWLGETLLSIG